MVTEEEVSAHVRSLISESSQLRTPRNGSSQATDAIHMSHTSHTPTTSADNSKFPELIRLPYNRTLFNKQDEGEPVEPSQFCSIGSECKLLDPYSRSAMCLYLIVFLCFINSYSNGYNSQVMIAVNGMQPFQDKYLHGRLGSHTGLAFSLYPAGSFAGSFVSGPSTDLIGRPRTILMGCLMTLLGSVLCTASDVFRVFLVGRFFLGFGVAFKSTASPAYVGEIAPPMWKSRALAIYNSGQILGIVSAAAIAWALSNVENGVSWRLAFGLEVLPTLFVGSLIIFMPESPRLLLLWNREEEAKAFLVRYHGNSDSYSPLVRLEWEQCLSHVREEPISAWWDFRELVVTQNARRRMTLVVLMSIISQCTGVGLSNFNFSGNTALGFPMGSRFAFNFLASCMAALGAILGVATVDRLPRRPVLIVGTLVGASLYALGGMFVHLYSNQSSPPVELRRAALAFLTLFPFVYSFTYVPLSALVIVECLPTSVRSKGLALSTLIVSLVVFGNQYGGAVALEHIKGNLIFVYMGIGVASSVIWYFFAIEAKGMSLEEMDKIFSAKSPVRTSVGLREAHLTLEKRALAPLVVATR